MSQGKLRADFSVTLSVHNASETRPLVLKRIAYFDTSGKMVESYLKSPVALKPFSTVEVFIAANDVRGGTGANFVVDWAATGEIAEPAVEALMVGSVGSRALCLHQPGAADQGHQELACKNYAAGRPASGLLNEKQNGSEYPCLPQPPSISRHCCPPDCRRRQRGGRALPNTVSSAATTIPTRFRSTA